MFYTSHFFFQMKKVKIFQLREKKKVSPQFWISEKFIDLYFVSVEGFLWSFERCREPFKDCFCLNLKKNFIKKLLIDIKKQSIIKKYIDNFIILCYNIFESEGRKKKISCLSAKAIKQKEKNYGNRFNQKFKI